VTEPPLTIGDLIFRNSQKQNRERQTLRGADQEGDAQAAENDHRV
jgi:hypothetical protein